MLALLVAILMVLVLHLVVATRASLLLTHPPRSVKVLPAAPPEVLARFHQEAESEQDLHEEGHHGTRKSGKKVAISYSPSARKIAIDHRVKTKLEEWHRLPKKLRPRQ
jgi:hypothetical protein